MRATSSMDSILGGGGGSIAADRQGAESRAADGATDRDCRVQGLSCGMSAKKVGPHLFKGFTPLTNMEILRVC